MVKVLFYTKENCPLCEDGISLLRMLQLEYSFEIEERDIYTNDEWLEEYQLIIPVAEVNGTQIDCEEMSYEAYERILQENK